MGMDSYPLFGTSGSVTLNNDKVNFSSWRIFRADEAKPKTAVLLLNPMLPRKNDRLNRIKTQVLASINSLPLPYISTGGNFFQIFIRPSRYCSLECGPCVGDPTKAIGPSTYYSQCTGLLHCLSVVPFWRFLCFIFKEKHNRFTLSPIEPQLYILAHLPI